MPSGASWLSWGLVKGAEFTGKAIHAGASKLREHITPEDKPAQVSPTVTKGLHVAKQATGGAVKVSQFLGDLTTPTPLSISLWALCAHLAALTVNAVCVVAVDGVCTVAGCVGRELAPHVKKHGGKLIPESMRKDKDGRSNIDGAMVVAASGVQGEADSRLDWGSERSCSISNLLWVCVCPGFATMWTGLEVAAKNITTSVASETVTTVKHKWVLLSCYSPNRCHQAKRCKFAQQACRFLCFAQWHMQKQKCTHSLDLSICLADLGVCKTSLTHLMKSHVILFNHTPLFDPLIISMTPLYLSLLSAVNHCTPSLSSSAHIGSLSLFFFHWFLNHPFELQHCSLATFTTPPSPGCMKLCFLYTVSTQSHRWWICNCQSSFTLLWNDTKLQNWIYLTVTNFPTRLRYN